MSQHDVVLNSAIEHKPYFYVNIADIDTLESEMSYVACEYHSCPSALRVCSGYFMVFLWCLLNLIYNYSQLCLSQIHWHWRKSFDLEKIQLYKG